ncbi:MAG TPA: hypothetical protein VM118_05030 [Acidobacteriota bacterium]|nr:hypothetical protein [Acidobacteriota bacterium]
MDAPACQHHWVMINVSFGFVAFETCYHCGGTRTFFTTEQTPLLREKYREGDHYWNRVENAQSFQFELHCHRCYRREKFEDLMGLLHCTGCRAECAIDVLRRRYESEGKWVLVAFGFLPDAHVPPQPIPEEKLRMLSEYFNQRRRAGRAPVVVVPFTLIPDTSLCFGDFLHDVGMLSQEPPGERRPLL